MPDHMISLNLLSLLLLFFSLSTASDINETSVCNASRYPATCKVLMSGLVPPTATPLQVIKFALSVVTAKLLDGQEMIKNVQNASISNANWTRAANSCLQSIEYSQYRLILVVKALNNKKKKHNNDALMLLSAALGYQTGCWSGLKYSGANTTAPGENATNFFNSTLIPITSSALGMLFNFDLSRAINDWGPAQTERDGFWKNVTSNSTDSLWEVGVPEGLKVDVTVCVNGCNFTTVQRAVNSAPIHLKHGKRFVIQIKAGVYTETVEVPLNKTNIVFLGEGMGKTIITGSRSVGLQVGMTTHDSATVGVAGDGFMACNLTIQNTAGAGAHQAVAFRSDSDKSVIHNCEFIGNQDTLNVGSLRQLYECCIIQGNVDFIFGNAAAVFEGCIILVAPRQIDPRMGVKNTVTAHGRTDPAQTTGFVFWNSLVNGTDDYMKLYYKNATVFQNYLGRPWKEYSRTVFIDCRLETLIAPEGWMRWDGDFALDTLYYGEHNNMGPGSNRSARVSWSNEISKEHVDSYSAQNFIQAKDPIY